MSLHENTLKIDANISISYNCNFGNKVPDDKPVILFFYGLVCNIQHFQYQMNYLSKKGYHVLIADYRFH